MGKNIYDLIIIGGGIVGLSLLKELEKKEVGNYLLLEKEKIGFGSSSSSSKLLHIGYRYLEYFDFKSFIEAFVETKYWYRNFPELVKPVLHEMPVFKNWGHKPTWLGQLVVALLQPFLTWFIEGKPRFFRRKKSNFSDFPGYKGSIFFWDYVMEDGEICEKIKSQRVHNKCQRDKNEIKENSEVINLEKTGESWNVILKNGEEYLAKKVVLAIGPWLVENEYVKNMAKKLLRISSGTQIYVDKVWLENAVFLHDRKRERLVYVVPEKGKRLEVMGQEQEEKSKFKEQIANVKLKCQEKLPFRDLGSCKDKNEANCTRVGITVRDSDKVDLSESNDEIEELLSYLKEFFPEQNIGYENIIKAIRGYRPHAFKKRAEEKKDFLDRTVRSDEIQPGLFVLVGGKFAIARCMAREFVRKKWKIGFEVAKLGIPKSL